MEFLVSDCAESFLTVLQCSDSNTPVLTSFIVGVLIAFVARVHYLGPEVLCLKTSTTCLLVIKISSNHTANCTSFIFKIFYAMMTQPNIKLTNYIIPGSAEHDAQVFI